MAAGQALYRDEPGPSDGHDNELGNAVTDGDRIRLGTVCIQKGHSDLAAIARVDGARGVDDSDAVLHGKTAARHDKGNESVRESDRNTGADGHALSRRELDGISGHQVRTGIPGMRVRRHRRGGDENFDTFGHDTRVVQFAVRLGNDVSTAKQ